MISSFIYRKVKMVQGSLEDTQPLSVKGPVLSSSTAVRIPVAVYLFTAWNFLASEKMERMG